MIIRFFVIIAVILTFLLYKLYNNYKENKSNDLNPNEVVTNNLTSNLTFEEVVNLLNSSEIKESSIIFHDSLSSINETINSLGNIVSKLVLFPTKRNYTLPDYLIYTNDSALKIAKSDIELYYKILEEFSIKTNNITNIVSESIHKYNNSLIDLKEDIKKIESEYEKMAKNLCLPLVLEKLLNDTDSTNTDKENKNKLRKLFDLKEVKESFLKSASNFINFINENLLGNKKQTDLFGSHYMSLGESAYEIAKEYNAFLNTFEDTIDFESQQDLHNSLTNTKKSYILEKIALEEKKREEEEKYKSLENEYNSKKINFTEFKVIFIDFVETLKENFFLTKEIVTKEMDKKNIGPIEIPDLNIPFIFPDSFIEKIGGFIKDVVDTQKKISNEFDSMINLMDVETKTSLDLLFIMDITGSMDYYLGQAKKNLFNIINRIITECPGIDINVGFIGYRDIEEFSLGEYSDIDFTQDYEYLQSIIEDVWAFGGADVPEDIAGAFEMALNKTWKNNARFAILVADAPCHGENCYSSYMYDYYPNGVPGRRNITDLVKDLAENNISLFCMRITYLTDTMFTMFGNIYKNYNNVEFHVDDMDYTETRFSDIVVEAASKVYANQRNIDS